jgi:hypothetical protein
MIESMPVTVANTNDDFNCSASLAASISTIGEFDPLDLPEIEVGRVSRSFGRSRYLFRLFLVAAVVASTYRFRHYFNWTSNQSLHHEYIKERLEFQHRIDVLEPVSWSPEGVAEALTKHGRVAQGEISKTYIVVDDDGVPKDLPSPNTPKPDRATIDTKSAAISLHAADALQCRESVINFVINATDMKDECEGLKKAFDMTCSNDGEAQHRRKTRTLSDKLGQKYRTHWQIWVWETARSLDSWLRYLFPSPYQEAFFLPEIEVSGKSWNDSYYLVMNGLDQLVYRDLRNKWILESEYDPFVHRMLQEEEENVAEIEDSEVNSTDVNTTIATLAPATNKTTTKPTTSLSLPTSSAHVSEKVLSEALILQQGDKLIERVTNQSNAAAQDAAQSSKAISDASAAVSAVLNDPDSIEARTCCASILNVYHENCSTDVEEDISDSRLFFIVLVIAFCGMVKSLIRHFKILWLPEAAGCIIVGGKSTQECICTCLVDHYFDCFISPYLTSCWYISCHCSTEWVWTRLVSTS